MADKPGGAMQRATLVIFVVLEDDNLDLGIQTRHQEMRIDLLPEQAERARQFVGELLRGNIDGDGPGPVGAHDTKDVDGGD